MYRVQSLGRRGSRWLILGALILGPSPALAAVPASAITEIQGVHVLSSGSVEVAASPAEAFEVLTDYDGMAKFLPGMLASRLVSREGRSVVVEQTAEEGMSFFSQRLTVRLAIEELPPYRLAVRALSGSFKELTGSYILTRRQDRTLIEYSARFIPDFHLPRMVGKYAVQHSLERHLNGLAAEILRRTATSGDTRKAEEKP